MASVSRTNFTYKDRLGKTSDISVNSTLLTGANFAAQATLRAAFAAALEDMTDGLLVKEEVFAAETKFTGALPTADDDLKSIKFLCRATDINGNAVTRHIPVADLSLTPGVNDHVDLTAGAGLAFKVAWDAFCKSNDGEDTVLNEVLYVDK